MSLEDKKDYIGAFSKIFFLEYVIGKKKPGKVTKNFCTISGKTYSMFVSFGCLWLSNINLFQPPGLKPISLSPDLSQIN